MKRTTLKTLIAVFAAFLTAELLFLGFLFLTDRLPEAEDVMAQPTAAPATTAETTAAPVTLAPTETTAAPTTVPETTVAPTTEPQVTTYTLTFVGDCTLGSEPEKMGLGYSFVGTVGTDYDYPFANVADYFKNDDLTLINLEGVLADSGFAQDKTFTFRGPTAYTRILTGSSVEAVTLANNHSYDFGKAGYDTTKQVLEEAGVAYVEENKTKIITTESGLKVGIYGDAFQFSTGEIAANVENLKKEGAEVIICAFHWGTEGSYRITSAQEKYAKAAIDAGAHIVWGHHPHVLQKMEFYNGGLILYSLGNFSFGGNAGPRDYDSALIQQAFIRSGDGSVSLGETTIVPVSMSSVSDKNNYQPTPYEAGSKEYDRVLSKLDGSFTGADLNVSYPKETTPAATAPAETAPAASEAPGETAAPTQAPVQTEAPVVTEAPAPEEPPAGT